MKKSIGAVALLLSLGLPQSSRAADPAQLYDVNDPSDPKQGYLVPTSDADSRNFRTCHGDLMTVDVTTIVPDPGNCDGNTNPLLSAAYIGQPVYHNGQRVGQVTGIVPSTDGGGVAGLVVNGPVQIIKHLPFGTTEYTNEFKSVTLAPSQWTLAPAAGAPIGNLSVVLPQALQLQSE